MSEEAEDLRLKFKKDPEFAFWFDLAHEMKIPVGELKARITPSEFLAWRVRAQLIPFGWRERESIAARQILIANRAAGGDATPDDVYHDHLALKIEEDDDFLELVRENQRRMKELANG